MTPIRHAQAAVRAGRAVVGTVAGAGSAVTGVVHLCRGSGAAVMRRAGADRKRLVRWFGADAVRDLPDRDPAGYLMRRAAYGPVVGAVVAGVLAAALGYASWALLLVLTARVPVLDATVALIVAAIATYPAVRTAVLSGRWDIALALRLLGDDDTASRVRELERTRAEVIRAIDDERRRIERALHDGIQQRAVVIALELGRVRRRAAIGDHALVTDLDRALSQTQALLTELREVAWRVYPASLDEHGLAAALRELSSHTALPVRLDLRLGAEPRRDVAAAVYFVAAEAVTNAAKHSGASGVDVTVTGPRDDAITVTVSDDGVGGADPSGSGLTGLRRRVAALDGALTVHSPDGGPTVVEARIPCVW
ncbi:MAG TPA: ATP-binding protein [Nocardia sp.]|uniref:sensor histidine kinase n=1 Tax=Nocardia sp. TaxID=1821 RepID=UPI002B4B2F07|nr:ATP-binding protein [Nocardia sp.]HLS79443.1 ATP-binding protein [Nocardia sp.]